MEVLDGTLDVVDFDDGVLDGALSEAAVADAAFPNNSFRLNMEFFL